MVFGNIVKKTNKSEKRVTEKKKKDLAFEVYLLIRKPSLS